MKRILMPLLLLTSPLAFADTSDVMNASCQLSIVGNDVTGGPKDLEEFEKPTRAYQISSSNGSNAKIKEYFKTVVPYAKDKNDYQKYQIVTFRSDTDSIERLSNDGIVNYVEKIRGQFTITLKYLGIPSGSRNRLVQVKINTPHGNNLPRKSENGNISKRKLKGINHEIPRNDSSYRITADMPVKFEYKDFGRDGLWGGIVDMVSDELDENSEFEMKTHESVVKLACDLDFVDKDTLDVDRLDDSSSESDNEEVQNSITVIGN